MNDRSDQRVETVPVTRIYPVDQISSAGISGRIEADIDQRKKIATALDLLELEEFKFEYRLHRISRGRFKLKGQLTARATQNCVVTLEPVPASIENTVEIDLWPAEDVERLESEAEQESMSVQLEGPEPIGGDSIDVGQLAYEHFAATLDLYPKKTNAKFDWDTQSTAQDGDTGDKPFAALAKLKGMSGLDSN